MKKFFKNKAVLSALIAVATVLVFTAGVFANSMIQEVTAHVNYNLKMKFDNTEWNPTEEDGAAIRPLTYKGRTYLPIRAVGEKLGIAIDYDAATQTVLLGEKDFAPLTKDMIVKCRHDNLGWTTDMEQLYCAGKTSSEGLVFNGNGYYDWATETTVDTSGKWQNVTMTVSYDKLGSDVDSINYIVKDTDYNGTVFKSVTVEDGKSVTFTANIEGCSKLFMTASYGSTTQTGKITVTDIKFN